MSWPIKGELEAARQTIKFFETLLRASADGIVITDNTQSIIAVNEAFCHLFNRSRSEVVETNLFVWLEKFESGALNQWTRLEKRLRDERSCSNVEFRIKKSGKLRYFDVNASLLDRIGEEETGATVSIWRETTERKQAEEMLLRSQREMRTTSEINNNLSYQS